LFKLITPVCLLAGRYIAEKDGWAAWFYDIIAKCWFLINNSDFVWRSSQCNYHAILNASSQSG